MIWSNKQRIDKPLLKFQLRRWSALFGLFAAVMAVAFALLNSQFGFTPQYVNWLVAMGGVVLFVLRAVSYHCRVLRPVS